MEMNTVRDVKDNKKGFMKCTLDKRKMMENVGPWLTETGDLLTHTWKRVRY